MRPIMPNWPSTEFPSEADIYSGELRPGPTTPTMISDCDLPGSRTFLRLSFFSALTGGNPGTGGCCGLCQSPNTREICSTTNPASTAPTTAMVMPCGPKV